MKEINLKTSYILKKKNIKSISVYYELPYLDKTLKFALINDKYEFWSDGVWISRIVGREIPQYCFNIQKDLERVIKKYGSIKFRL